MPRFSRSFVFAAILLSGTAQAEPAGSVTSSGKPQPRVEIYMPSPCLACIDWGAYLADNGFKVTYKETADMAAVKRRFFFDNEF